MADTNNTLGIGEGLPPCGGSGLKLHFGNFVKKKSWSPSMRREWIEMICQSIGTLKKNGLPPCGGSGLKYAAGVRTQLLNRVSLHAEGVD